MERRKCEERERHQREEQQNQGAVKGEDGKRVNGKTSIQRCNSKSGSIGRGDSEGDNTGRDTREKRKQGDGINRAREGAKQGTTTRNTRAKETSSSKNEIMDTEARVTWNRSTNKRGTTKRTENLKRVHRVRRYTSDRHDGNDGQR